MDYEISCGFVLINPNSGNILILKLSRDFEWDLPKGHQEKEETKIETAFREVNEETQIDKTQIKIIKNSQNKYINNYFEYQSPVSGNTRRIYLYLGTTTKNPIISNEHCGFAWCNLEETLKYLKFEDIQNCVEKLYSNYITSLNKK